VQVNENQNLTNRLSKLYAQKLPYALERKQAEDILLEIFGYLTPSEKRKIIKRIEFCKYYNKLKQTRNPKDIKGILSRKFGYPKQNINSKLAFCKECYKA
jgi:hypothetical protein